MSFVQISSVEAQELIRDLPHNEMKTYICEEPINIRFGEEKLLAKAFTMIGRDIQYGESFFFINKDKATEPVSISRMKASEYSVGM